MSGNSQGFQYHVDLMLVIDGTASMGHVIDGVKTFAASIHGTVMAALRDANKTVDKMRVGVIVFRDFSEDGGKGLEVLPLRNVPEEETVIHAFVSSIEPTGGGDIPENGLEALGVAFRQDWTSAGTRQRHVLILFTDAEPHPYKSVAGPAMPKDIPDTYDDLLMEYAGGTQKPGRKLKDSAKRLVLFAPKGGQWDALAAMDMVAHQELEAMLGNSEATLKGLVNAIVSSV